MQHDTTRPAIHCGARSRAHCEVRERAARLATALRRLGIGHGDRYAVVLRNEIEFLEALVAAAAIGAVPVPVNWHRTGVDLEHLLHDSGAKVVLVHTDLLPAVERYVAPGVRVIEVELTDELRAAYHLEGIAVTGRHPTLEQLIADSEPVTEPVDDPPLGLIYSSGTTGLAKGILRQPMTREAV